MADEAGFGGVRVGEVEGRRGGEWQRYVIP